MASAPQQTSNAQLALRITKTSLTATIPQPAGYRMFIRKTCNCAHHGDSTRTIGRLYQRCTRRERGRFWHCLYSTLGHLTPEQFECCKATQRVAYLLANLSDKTDQLHARGAVEKMRVLVLCAARERQRVESEFGAFASVAFCESATEFATDVRTPVVLVLWAGTTTDGEALHKVRDWRNAGQKAPILVVASSWQRDSAARLLDAGADECVVGDYAQSELHARTCALVRRSSPPPGLLSDTCVQLDREGLTARMQGREVGLTRTQFSILEYLVRHRDCWRSPEAIFREVLGTRHHKDSSLVRFHVHRSRSALGESRACILGERGKGYMFRSPLALVKPTQN
jgi:two-component system, OmpR family, response regulator